MRNAIILLAFLALTACKKDNTATDAATSSSGGTTTVTTTAANRAPSISGAPAAAATVGQSYTFTPSAGDPDGNAISFAIQNKPAWATFSATTGTLTGTPAAGDVGNFASIIISVNDGNLTTSLPAFSISVSAPLVTVTGPGTVTLNWTTPANNTDGSTLTDLSGFKVYYGTSPGSLVQVVNISSSSTNSLVISNLSTGTWYFGITALNSAGGESAMSNIATQSIT